MVAFALTALRNILNFACLAVPCLLLGWLIAGRLLRASLDNLLEQLIGAGLVGFISLSWVGAILASVSLFRWWAVLLCMVVLAVTVRWFCRNLAVDRGHRRLLPEPKWAGIVLLLVLGFAACLFAQPAQSFYLADDSSVYTLGGVLLARDGTWWAHLNSFWQNWSPVTGMANYDHSATTASANFYIADIDLYRRLIYGISYSETNGTLTRFIGGFYQWTIMNPIYEVAFLGLPKVWTAFSVWLLGTANACCATPWMGWLGLASFTMVIRRTANWRASLIATLLLALSLPQIWFSRYPISEA